MVTKPHVSPWLHTYHHGDRRIPRRTGASYSRTGLLPPGLTADKVRELNSRVQKLQQEEEKEEELTEEEVSLTSLSSSHFETVYLIYLHCVPQFLLGLPHCTKFAKLRLSQLDFASVYVTILRITCILSETFCPTYCCPTQID